MGNLSLSLAVSCFTVAGAMPHEGVGATTKSIAYNSLAGINIVPALNYEPKVKPEVNAPTKLFQVVSGKVTGDDGEGLPGVTVRLKGNQTIGTVTDLEGNYSINIPDDVQNPVLVFSFVGFSDREVPVDNRSVVDIQLLEDVQALEEVVVVGYGTQRREEITSAVSSVSAEEFNKGNITDVAQLMQGKVAGLSIARAGGDPNAGFAIRLRGLSTLGANAQPLVVVDGQVGADMNTIDPNDIESIDVLKDAASSAIYGTRGSAGVIIITTKSGTYGEPRITYNTALTIDQPFRFTPNMTSAEYRELGIGADYGANTNWNEEISRTAISHTHNLSLSGGSKQTSYNASVNYRDNQGVAINTGFNQLNGRFNLTQHALKDKLTLNLNVTATKRESMLGFPEAFKYATIFNPTAPVRTDDPQFDLSGGGYFESNFVDYANPVAILEQNQNERDLQRFNFTGTAEYEIIDGLKFLVRYAQQTTNVNRRAYFPRTSFHSRNFLGVSGYSRGGFAFRENQESYNQLYENTLSYDRRLGDLNVSAVGGYSYQDFLNQGASMRAGNFITDASADDISSALDFETGRASATSYKNASRLVAFFGRLNLNYNNFAFLTASLRREGSTQFGANNKWGMFPAVSAGLDVTRFTDIPAVDNLKFRASYGVTGALPPESYLSLPTLSAGGASFYAGNGVYLQSYGPDKNPNPDLKWETKAEFDIGLDFSLFNNRLNGSMDYYNRTTSDLLFNVTVPVPPNLVSRTWMNIGEMQNKGFELSLDYNVISRDDFSWNTGGNFSTYNVMLTSLNPELAGSYVGESNLGTPGQEATQITRAVEGENIGILWGYQYDGLNELGEYGFTDLNGDGIINNDDRTIIGNGLPDFEFGWTNTFQYKNFDLNFFFRGSFGHDLINTYRAFYENPNIATSYNVVKSKYYDPAIQGGQEFSSLFVESASFVKLDNATLGYNFRLPQGAAFKSIRAFVNGQNLLVFTDYTGVDPEVRYAYGNNILAPGVDPRESWVLARTFTVGVNLGF